MVQEKGQAKEQAAVQVTAGTKEQGRVKAYDAAVKKAKEAYRATDKVAKEKYSAAMTPAMETYKAAMEKAKEVRDNA